MPKRSAQKKIDRYRMKIQKLEEKEKQRYQRVAVSSSEDENYEKNENVVYLDTEQTLDETNFPGNDDTAIKKELTPEATLAEPDPGSLQEPSTSQAAGHSTAEFALDPELLAALGASTSATPDFAENIHQSLAQLWSPLLKKGLPKDSKDEFLKQYLIPDNCKLLQAPRLNVEISVAVSDMIRNRDKKLLNMQQQLGVGATAVNRAMDVLLKGGDKTQALAHLSTSCRLLTDLHFAYTDYRIKLLMYGLDKSFSRVIEDSERDDTLFGNTLSEKIKITKTVEKQGFQLKRSLPLQKVAGAPATVSRPVHQQGNWHGPPRYSSNREGRGGHRRPGLSMVRRSYPPPPPMLATLSQPRLPYQSRLRAPTRPSH